MEPRRAEVAWIFLHVDAEGRIANQLFGFDDFEDQAIVLATFRKLRSGSRSLFAVGVLERLRHPGNFPIEPEASPQKGGPRGRLNGRG
jgi:hypothetical protein